MRLFLLFSCLSIFSCKEPCVFEDTNIFVLNLYENGENVNDRYKEELFNYQENAPVPGLIKGVQLEFDSLSLNFQGTWKNNCPNETMEFLLSDPLTSSDLDVIEFTLNRFEVDGCMKCSFDGARSLNGNSITLKADTFFIEVDL